MELFIQLTIRVFNYNLIYDSNEFNSFKINKIFQGNFYNNYHRNIRIFLELPTRVILEY